MANRALNPLRKSRGEQSKSKARWLLGRAAKTAQPPAWRYRRQIGATVAASIAALAGVGAYLAYRLKRSRRAEAPEPGAFAYPGSDSTRTPGANGSVETPDPVPSATAAD